MDLILEQQRSGKITKDSHFVCSECGDPLIDASKFTDISNATLSKKKRFNDKIKTLKQLLIKTQKAYDREQGMMRTEVSKLEDTMDRIKNGSSHNLYKASTLSFDAKTMSKQGTNKRHLTGLTHLDSIGQRRHNFECKLDEENDDGEAEGNNEEVSENGNAGKIDSAKEKVEREKEIKRCLDVIKGYEIKQHAEMSNVDTVTQDFDLYCSINVKVANQEIKMSEILNGDSDKYEAKMSVVEWNEYQRMLDELGLLEVE